MKRRILWGRGRGEDYTQSSKRFNDGILSVRQGRCLVKCWLVGGKWFSSQSTPKVIITRWVQFGVVFMMWSFGLVLESQFRVWQTAKSLSCSGGLCHRGLGLPDVCGSLSQGVKSLSYLGVLVPGCTGAFIFSLKVEFHFCFVSISLTTKGALHCFLNLLARCIGCISFINSRLCSLIIFSFLKILWNHCKLKNHWKKYTESSCLPSTSLPLRQGCQSHFHVGGGHISLAVAFKGPNVIKDCIHVTTP